MIYFDIAYIAKCSLNEPRAEKVRAVADAHMAAAGRYFRIAVRNVI